MRLSSVQLWIGMGLFVLGGAVLAYGEGEAWTVMGTTMGLAGVGLAIWSWIRRQAGEGR
ncbi:MAG: hypothetical protein ACYSTY_04890 [Planctomycetota bacterium]|jgi:hypothetical protein